MLRFQRIGRRNDPAFRIVATEKRSKPKSGFLEILGSYHPKTKDTQLKNERILYWLSKGAQASETVHNLLVSKGVIQGTKVAIKMNKAVVKEPEAVKETKEVGAAKEPEVVKEEVASTVEEKKEEPAVA
ncbi:MAG: 30S ribosomal protein S16 [bacterium]|nr:30S ribosomal protein S16 [bacterium]